MKTFLIVLLTAALLAAACFTRPDEQNFRDHLARSRAAGAPGAARAGARDATNFSKAMAEMEADAFAEACEFKDRLLWVDVQRDGRTIYTGAFAHWFKYTNGDGLPSVTKSVASKPAPARAPEPRPAAARNPAKRRPAAGIN